MEDSNLSDTGYALIQQDVSHTTTLGVLTIWCENPYLYRTGIQWEVRPISYRLPSLSQELFLRPNADWVGLGVYLQVSIASRSAWVTGRR